MDDDDGQDPVGDALQRLPRIFESGSDDTGRHMDATQRLLAELDLLVDRVSSAEEIVSVGVESTPGRFGQALVRVLVYFRSVWVVGEQWHATPAELSFTPGAFSDKKWLLQVRLPLATTVSEAGLRKREMERLVVRGPFTPDLIAGFKHLSYSQLDELPSVFGLFLQRGAVAWMKLELPLSEQCGS